MGGTTDFTDDMITMGLQTTTHWDGLCHVYYGDKLYNGYPASSVDIHGAHKNAIGALYRDMVARGVLLDIARYKNVRALAPGYAIRPDELLSCAEHQGVAIEEGDILVIRTGAMADIRDDDWSKFWGNPRPGLHYSVAELIAERGIAAVCADNNAVEASSTVKGLSNPFHMVALRDMGVSIGEFWYLEDLADDCAEDRVYEFMLVAQPLRIEEGAGSPVNPLAIK
jgi:kynurenine formamidase